MKKKLVNTKSAKQKQVVKDIVATFVVVVTHLKRNTTDTVLKYARKPFAFKQAIKDGHNGYLSRSFEWYEKIQDVINLLRAGTYSEIAENAFNHSKHTYAWYNQTELIERTLFHGSG